MTPTQLRAMLSRLGITQTEAGKVLRVEGRQVRRWIAGVSPVPFLVAVILRLWAEGRISRDDIR